MHKNSTLSDDLSREDLNELMTLAYMIPIYIVDPSQDILEIDEYFLDEYSSIHDVNRLYFTIDVRKGQTTKRTYVIKTISRSFNRLTMQLNT
jgi:hypothetical protein